jgi:hypothetical protein
MIDSFPMSYGSLAATAKTAGRRIGGMPSRFTSFSAVAIPEATAAGRRALSPVARPMVF